MRHTQPLVSIVVVTYNASKFVLETLESVKAQTYQNIELIITDDHSPDNTIEICSEWIKNNCTRFTNTKIVTSEVNTGITANRNRGCFAAKGTWLKHIDGDDKLKSTCISDYIKYVDAHPDKNMVFSPLALFGKGVTPEWERLMRSNYRYAFSLNNRDFRILLCKVCLFGAPSLFINTEYFKSMNGYDESIKMLEDWPFWVRSAFNGAHFAYIETPEVEYRISEASLSQGLGDGSNRYKEALRQVEKKTLHYMKQISWLYYLEGIIVYKNKYEQNIFWRLMAYFRPLNPFFWKVRKLYFNYKLTNNNSHT